MLDPERRNPRAPGDARRYLYFDYSAQGALRWYVKVSAKGRRIGIALEYGSAEFDAAYAAAIAALGGVTRMRRIGPVVKPDQPERRYLHADVSQRGQLRYYVQLRKALPKIRILAAFGTPEFESRSMRPSPPRLRAMAPTAITSTRRSSATRHGLRCRPRCPSPARCAGTGRATRGATTGSAT